MRLYPNFPEEEFNDDDFEEFPDDDEILDEEPDEDEDEDDSDPDFIPGDEDAEIE